MKKKHRHRYVYVQYPESVKQIVLIPKMFCMCGKEKTKKKSGG